MVGYYKPAVLSTHWRLWWIIHWWVEDWLLFQVGGLNRQGSTPLLFRTCSSCSIWLRKTSALAYSSNTWACILTLKHLETVVFWKNLQCISVLLVSKPRHAKALRSFRQGAGGKLFGHWSRRAGETAGSCYALLRWENGVKRIIQIQNIPSFRQLDEMVGCW